MQDLRSTLRTGTVICLGGEHRYIITGEPIGFGGGSIIYPARRAAEGIAATEDMIDYAVKECFPVSSEYVFRRGPSGEIAPETPSEESLAYLETVRGMMLRESRTSQQIYQKASRVIPIREVASKAELLFPSGESYEVNNTYTVMDSLYQKGRSLGSLLKESGKISTLTTFEIIKQLLTALKEVHDAGFVHLDIQDGNIFIHGMLGQTDELVTLIDFGAARRLTNGMTEPITDKVLFTTGGFTAPEAVFENDGSLQLGPETDIYSVGCLILYMLTGEKYPLPKLLQTTDELYLTRFKLRKIDCPPHLVERMQRIIARALKKDRTERYQSAGEMLTEVIDFLEALKPRRSEIMSAEYDAFICYRHGELDSAAARVLQAKLEHFRAPRGISEKKHPIQRVFLDEGELSSCADFGEQIEYALKNAEWLIVVCSTQTPGSPWVDLEIKTFLKYHDASRILALLIDGEPEEAFPDRLKGESGTDQVLAADARGKNRKEVLKRIQGDGLLKIAAPMLHTTFDSLKQRRKMAQIRRNAYIMSGISAALFLFFGYAYLQSSRLNAQYRETAYNQSLYLSNQAMQKYQNLEYYDAMELALQALTSGTEVSAPVIPEAQLVLTDALNLYAPDETLSVVDNYRKKYSYSRDETVFVDEENKKLFFFDGSLTMWDMNRKEEISVLPAESGRVKLADESLLLIGKSMILYGGYNDVYAYDYEKQELTWTVETASLMDVRYSEAAEKVYYLDSDGIHELNVDSGEETALYSCGSAVYNDGETYSWEESPLCLDESGKRAAVIVREMEENQEEATDHILLLDTDTEEYHVYEPEVGTIASLQFTKEGQLLLIGPKASAAPQYSTTNTLSIIDETAKTCSFTLWDTLDGSVLWNREVSNPYWASMNACVWEEDGIGIFISGNTCMQINMSDGEMLRSWELEDPILEFQDFVAERISVITQNGYIYYLPTDQTETSYSQKILADRILAITSTDRSFFVSYVDDGNDYVNIVEYEYLENENWTVLCDDYPDYSVEQSFCSDDGETVAMLANDSAYSADDPLTCVVSSGENTHRYTLDLTEESSVYADDFLGIYQVNGRDCLLLPFSELQRDTYTTIYKIWCIDLESMSDTILQVPYQRTDRIITEPIYRENAAYYYSYEDGVFYRWDIGADEPEALSFADQIAGSVCDLALTASGEGMFVIAEETVEAEDVENFDRTVTIIYYVDFAKNRVKEVLRRDKEDGDRVNFGFWDQEITRLLEMTEETVKIYDQTGEILGTVSHAFEEIPENALVDEQNIYLYFADSGILTAYRVSDGKALWHISLASGESTPGILGIRDGKLLIFQSDTKLFSVYGISDGACIWEDHLDNADGSLLVKAKYDEEEKELFLFLYRDCYLISLSDESTGILAHVKNAFDYGNDRFYTIKSDSSQDHQIGYLSRYSTEEIINLAGTVLGK